VGAGWFQKVLRLDTSRYGEIFIEEDEDEGLVVFCGQDAEFPETETKSVLQTEDAQPTHEVELMSTSVIDSLAIAERFLEIYRHFGDRVHWKTRYSQMILLHVLFVSLSPRAQYLLQTIVKRPKPNIPKSAFRLLGRIR
jgi:hypothetical protein